jgi:diadenylate cyclase
LEFLLKVIQNFSLNDLLDVGIVALIIYRFLLIVQGTRAVQMITGLFALMCIYWVSVSFKLYSLNFILSKFFDYFFVIMIILFQEQIRVALVSFGETKMFSRRRKTLHDEDLEEVVKVCKALSSEKTGGLLVFEKNHGLLNYSITGTRLNSNIHSDILYSIFQTKSPLHDGAVIIFDGKVQAAGCFLPLSKNVNIEKHYGTRHRAALGVTELTDAVVVIVSEETGEIKLCFNGEFYPVENETSLRNKLSVVLRTEEPTKDNINGAYSVDA